MAIAAAGIVHQLDRPLVDQFEQAQLGGLTALAFARTLGLGSFGHNNIRGTDLFARQPKRVTIDHVGFARCASVECEQGGGREEKSGHGPLTAAAGRKGVSGQIRCIPRKRRD